MRMFEDFDVGQRFDLDDYELTQDEILEFARAYDPQPFHVDPEAARDTVFGGLIASGFQTAAIFMRLYCDAFLLESASMGSPGLEELRWRAPVRPGDVLTGHIDVVDAYPSTSTPERGTLILEGTLRVGDRVVLTTRFRGLFARRDVDDHAGGDG